MVFPMVNEHWQINHKGILDESDRQMKGTFVNADIIT